MSISPSAIGASTTGALLEIKIYNADPYPQDVKLTLKALHGLVGFEPGVQIPFVEQYIQTAIPPAPPHVVRLSLKVTSNGQGRTETLTCSEVRYRTSGAKGWSGRKTPTNAAAKVTVT